MNCKITILEMDQLMHVFSYRFGQHHCQHWVVDSISGRECFAYTSERRTPPTFWLEAAQRDGFSQHVVVAWSGSVLVEARWAPRGGSGEGPVSEEKRGGWTREADIAICDG